MVCSEKLNSHCSVKDTNFFVERRYQEDVLVGSTGVCYA